MKVLLIKDVYKLGHAGDVKKVAAGYGRNYLLPQGLAVLATPGALKQADRIREEAAVERANLNQELSGVADKLSDLMLTFAAKAGEGEKLYGSITTRMIADAIVEETGIEVTHKQVYSQPIRTIGIHTVSVRLTVDLVPEVQVVVYREGESAQMVLDEAAAAEAEALAAEAGEETPAAEDAPEAESEPGADVEAVEEFSEPEAEDQAEAPVAVEVEKADESSDRAEEEPPAEDPEEVLEADES
ncbi:MAG: 50S ribosomal protein L9 [Anaerolineales bacterium]|nr:50S ribosomal protein L9 [Anaerolineales bacterium]